MELFALPLEDLPASCPQEREIPLGGAKPVARTGVASFPYSTRVATSGSDAQAVASPDPFLQRSPAFRKGFSGGCRDSPGSFESIVWYVH